MQHGGKIFILAGSGPYLRIYDETTDSLLSSHRVFGYQTIHGIISIGRTAPQKNPEYDVVVWGGRSIASVCLKLVDGISTEVFLSTQFELPEWILKVDWTCHPKTQETSAVAVTTHNVLHGVSLTGATATACKAGESYVLSRGPSTFLYSADLKVVSAEQHLVASGSVFGEIIVWTCHQDEGTGFWTTHHLHTLRGHSGSIFGVSISDVLSDSNVQTRFVAGCSDDRTIRIWDIGLCNDEVADSPVARPSDQTGFGQNITPDRDAVTYTYAHLSRIWGVDFIQLPDGRQASHSILLVSRGEDGACQFWGLARETLFRRSKSQLSKQAAGFSLLQADRHHVGKNIWSMAHVVHQDKIQTLTGGADGQIVSRRFQPQSGMQPFDIQLSVPFSRINEKSKYLKQYLVLGHDQILATTDRGDVLYGRIQPTSALEWQAIYFSTTAKPSLVSTNMLYGRAILVTSTRSLYIIGPSIEAVGPPLLTLDAMPAWVQIMSQHQEGASHSSSDFCAVVGFPDTRQPFMLWCWQNKDSWDVKITPIETPATFNITTATYDPHHSILFLGSRAGALAVYHNVDSEAVVLRPAYCKRHAHDSDSVTSILLLPIGSSNAAARSPNPILILTTGRNGKYAIHKITPTQVSKHSDLETIHVAEPPFGPYIEGADLVPSTSNTGTLELILHGFRSQEFVVWNETRQALVMTVECGGAHRSWAFRSVLDDTSTATETFIWSRAGSFNLCRRGDNNLKQIQSGCHGREIKALAVYCSQGKGRDTIRTIIATGAEDTTIRVFDPSTFSVERTRSGKNDLVPCVLKTHTTGLQQLRFSDCGSYLFSSAGCEELKVWKLSQDITGIGTGVTLEATLLKNGEDGDVRIMDFDLRYDDHSGGDHKFSLVAAYSNGKLRILDYYPQNMGKPGRFETVQEIILGSFCLTQALFLAPRTILSAGTNGYLNWTSLELCNSTQTLKSQHVHQVHQSTILSMDSFNFDSHPAAELENSASRGRSMWLVASGGDDNAVAFTFIESTTGNQTASPPSPRFRSILIPNAHAAAVTSIKILPPDKLNTHIDIVSAGNDQKVKVWRLTIAPDTMSSQALNLDAVGRYEIIETPNGLEPDATWSPDNVTVDKIAQCYTSVADVSSLELLPESSISASGATITSGLASNTNSQPDSKPQHCETSRNGIPTSRIHLIVAGVGIEVIEMIF